MSTENPSEKKMQSVMDQVTDQVGKSPSVNPKKRKAKPSNKPPETEPTKASKVQVVDINVPIMEANSPSWRLHLEVNLYGKHAIVFRDIVAALKFDGARLENGQECRGVNDAARWLIEQVANQTG